MANSKKPKQRLKGLQSVDFFITLPDPIDIEDGINFPLVEIDDTTVTDAIRFLDKAGLSKRFNHRMMFHQIPISESEHDTSAALQAFSSFIGTPQGELKMPSTNTKVTVIQIGCIVRKQEVTEDLFSNLFDEAIVSIRRYLRGYHLVTQRAVELVSRQTTSAFVPYSVQDIDEKGEFVDSRSSLQQGLLLTHHNKSYSTTDHSITTDQLDLIAQTSTTYLDNLFDNFSNVRREAYLAFEKGNALVAGFLIGAAAEIFLDELLLFLLWEDGTTPEQAKAIFEDPDTDTTFRRIQSDLYSSRIGGNWSLVEKGSVIHKWRHKILEPRNKIAHTGHEPSQKEMNEAFDSLTELVSYVVDLLCQKMKRYPVTADVVAGSDSMKKRGCFDEFVDYIKQIEYPANPQMMFGNWKYEIERLRKDKPFIGNYKKSGLGYLIHADGTEMWLLVDEANRLVKRIPEQTITNKAVKDSFDEVRKKVLKNRKKLNTLIDIKDVKAKYTRNKDEVWLPVYTVSDIRSISCWPISYLPPR